MTKCYIIIIIITISKKKNIVTHNTDGSYGVIYDDLSADIFIK